MFNENMFDENMFNVYDILRKYIYDPKKYNPDNLYNLTVFLLTYKSKLLKNKDTSIIYINDNKYKNFYINTLGLNMCDKRNCFLDINEVNELLI